ncbi:MAG: hypothetical protein Q7J80_11200 [Anaerolineales bacterium]|nr:hypothetical protein [Anaerolineales bacterium]
MSKDEQERLRQLRERQLQARDPLANQRKFQRNSSIKEKRAYKPFSLAKAWKDIPHIVKSPFYGLILGVIIVFILPAIWDSPYAIIVGAGLTLFLILFGLIAGNSLDLRDNIKEHLK